MSDLTLLNNDQLQVKFDEVKETFMNNINDKSTRDALNEELSKIVEESKRRNISLN